MASKDPFTKYKIGPHLGFVYYKGIPEICNITADLLPKCG